MMGSALVYITMSSFEVEMKIGYDCNWVVGAAARIYVEVVYVSSSLVKASKLRKQHSRLSISTLLYYVRNFREFNTTHQHGCQSVPLAATVLRQIAVSRVSGS
jgi:hypothetical protein